MHIAHLIANAIISTIFVLWIRKSEIQFHLNERLSIAFFISQSNVENVFRAITNYKCIVMNMKLMLNAFIRILMMLNAQSISRFLNASTFNRNIPLIQTNSQVQFANLHIGIYMNWYKGINIAEPQAIHKLMQNLFQASGILEFSNEFFP